MVIFSIKDPFVLAQIQQLRHYSKPLSYSNETYLAGGGTCTQVTQGWREGQGTADIGRQNKLGEHVDTSVGTLSGLWISHSLRKLKESLWILTRTPSLTKLVSSSSEPSYKPSLACLGQF